MNIEVNFTEIPQKQVIDLDATISLLYAAPNKRLNFDVDRKQARVIEMAVRNRSEGRDRATLAAIKVGSEIKGFEITIVPASGRTRAQSEALPSVKALEALDRSLKGQP